MNDRLLRRGLRWSMAHYPQIYRYVSDETYLRWRYWAMCGKKLDIDNPISFNEKLQWLKLYDHNFKYIKLVDKYTVKQEVACIIGEQYLIPTLGIWDYFEDIDFNSLPEQFVLKCTHDSGGIVICTNKHNLNMVEVRNKIKDSLNKNYYYWGREWPYKNVKPRVIAEQYMTDESGIELKDYKIFCFSGEPKLIQVDFDRFIEHKRNLYTPEWEYINASIEFPTDKNRLIQKPKKLDEMLILARKLSKGIPHVRTDFYSIEDKIYFGEMTFYHGSGCESFNPEEFGLQMGAWIDLKDIPKR